VQAVVRFIVNYAAQHCILLPGRIPGIKSTDVKLLPTSITKAHLWRLYRDSLPRHEAVALSTFRKLWKDLLPYIAVAKPATDLCWTCQKNNSLIIKQVYFLPRLQPFYSSNIPDFHSGPQIIHLFFIPNVLNNSTFLSTLAVKKHSMFERQWENVPSIGRSMANIKQLLAFFKICIHFEFAFVFHFLMY
jgi:hypothetical protein